MSKKTKKKKEKAVPEKIHTKPLPTLGAEELKAKKSKTKAEATPKPKSEKKAKTKAEATPKPKSEKKAKAKAETKPKSEKKATAKTSPKTKKDVWGFIKGKKNSLIIRTLNDAGDKGVTIEEIAEAVHKEFPDTPVAKAKAHIRQTLGDFQLDPGTWCASRGIKLIVKGDRYIMPKKVRKVYED